MAQEIIWNHSRTRVTNSCWNVILRKLKLVQFITEFPGQVVGPWSSDNGPWLSCQRPSDHTELLCLQIYTFNTVDINASVMWCVCQNSFLSGVQRHLRSAASLTPVSPQPGRASLSRSSSSSPFSHEHGFFRMVDMFVKHVLLWSCACHCNWLSQYYVQYVLQLAHVVLDCSCIMHHAFFDTIVTVRRVSRTFKVTLEMWRSSNSNSTTFELWTFSTDSKFVECFKRFVVECEFVEKSLFYNWFLIHLSLIHIWRCRRRG